MTYTSVVTTTDAVFLFLAGMGLMMTAILWWWQRKLNGDRRVSSHVVTFQAAGWILLLVRLIYADLMIAPETHPPVWYYIIVVGLMDIGQYGHLMAILKRKHVAFKFNNAFKPKEDHEPNAGD